MSLEVVRMKRKANVEPAENLVIALKRSKLDERQVHLKLATTVDGKAIERKQIHADITRAKLRENNFRLSPKSIGKSDNSVQKRLQDSLIEQKKKRSQMHDQYRLVLSEQDQKGHSSDTDVDESEFVFKLYDVEVNEDSKVVNEKEDAGKSEAKSSNITCNEQPLDRVPKAENVDYVYDMYYIAKGDLNERFTQDSLSIEPYETELAPSTEDKKYECKDDDDDSNDEDNWRNYYPDVESDYDTDYYYDSDEEIAQSLQNMNIDDESPAYSEYKERVRNELYCNSGDEDGENISDYG